MSRSRFFTSLSTISLLAFAFALPASGAGADSGSTTGTGTGTTGTEVNATVNTGSIYLTDTAKFGQTWTLIGNVRYDHVSSRYFESIAPTAEFDQDDNLFIWRAGLVFQPKPNGSIYISSGTSVHPNIAQLALSSEPTLPPETPLIAKR